MRLDILRRAAQLAGMTATMALLGFGIACGGEAAPGGAPTAEASAPAQVAPAEPSSTEAPAPAEAPAEVTATPTEPLKAEPLKAPEPAEALVGSPTAAPTAAPAPQKPAAGRAAGAATQAKEGATSLAEVPFEGTRIALVHTSNVIGELEPCG